MTIDQLTDLAYEVANELEPAQSFDVFEVSESQIIFNFPHGLKRICAACLDGSLKEQVKNELMKQRD
jgi:hypothetical protein